MKNLIFTILIFVFSIQTYACTCTPTNLNESFLTSDFVAKIKIIKKYKNIDNDDYYKADIEVLDLYKGDFIKTINIYGNSDINDNAPCWLYTEINETLIVYAIKNKEGKNLIQGCSRVLFLNKETNSEETNLRNLNEINVLNVLKDNKVSFKSKFNTRFSEELAAFSRSLKGGKVNNTFGIYEILIDSNFKTKCVKKLQGLGSQVDRRIKRFLKRENWHAMKRNNQSIEDKNKHLIIIYCYKYKNITYFHERFTIINDY